jgi:hypothetical protein
MLAVTPAVEDSTLLMRQSPNENVQFLELCLKIKKIGSCKIPETTRWTGLL